MSDDAEPRAWEHVLAHVEARLLAGELRPGDRLPGERALSVELGVGRSSVREALRALEVLGLVRTAAGSGPSAGAVITATPQGGMSALMRLQVAASGFPVADVVATRLLLERAVAEGLAARVAANRDASPRPADGSRTETRNASPHPADGSPAETRDASPRPADAAGEPGHASSVALDDAERLLDAMDAPGLPIADFMALDAAFHLALAVEGGNQVVAATMAGLRSGIERYAVAGAESLPDWPAMNARLRAEHRGVLAAIRAGDPAGAGHRIHTHIAGFYSATRP